MIEFFVTKGQELKRRDHDVVSADTTDLKVQFDLTSDFTGTITVWWRRSDKPGITWTSTLSGNQCTIPAETLSAATDNVMYGEYDHFVFVSISDTGRTTSSECEIKVNKSAFSTNATPGTGGSSTAYEELVEQFDELKADNQTFKENMTEQQETFESTVTENVDNIRYVVETETAPPVIEEASGAEITLDDSAYRQVRGLNLYGYSKQIQTTGAQLYDAESAKSGHINTSNGNLEQNGTWIYSAMISANSNAEYTLSEKKKGYYSQFSFIFYDSQYQFISGKDFSGQEITPIVAETPQNTSYMRIQYSINLSGEAIQREEIMLNAGTSALPWEPYSGGVASPSPDWAQPITSVGDGGSVTVNSVGANLFPALDVQEVMAGGATIRNNNDGSLTISGSGNLTKVIFSENALNHAESVQRLKAGQYTLSGAEPGQPYIFTSYRYNNDINIEGNTRTSSESTIEISQDVLNNVSSYIRFGFYGPSGSTITQQTVWPMFNRGSTPLPWQPYAVPSSALIALTDSLRGIPVTSGGNYTDESGQQWIADYIYRRQTDGKWMLWRNCGRLAIDGSYGWAVNRQNETFAQFTSRPSILSAKQSNIVSEIGVGEELVKEGFWIYNQNTPVLILKKTSLPSVSSEAVKEWCGENPFSVVYQLATPTIEELPENVQTELNGLYTYNLHTDMWNNDGAYMGLKYVADTKTWINNKIAGLSTAMIENL